MREVEVRQEPWTHRQAIVNGVRLHYVEAGEGPLVLLLHGFPEFWYSWRFQIPALAAAGFHVVAPDMRGYNLSEKPPGIRAYHIDNLVADVAALLRMFGGESGGFLVGHDWGGVVAWHTASRCPDLVRKLVILNVPHPNRYLEVLRTYRDQMLRSQYVTFFQLPFLPEWLLTRRKGELVERSMRASGMNQEHFTGEDARLYREAITRPGAARAALNYYRSIGWRTLLAGMREDPRHIAMPTLLLWGRNDLALHIANADREALLRWVPDLRVETFEASHFVHIDLPERVNELMTGFFH